MLPQLNEWQIKDKNGIVMPYYTHPSLEWIESNLIGKGLSVLEFGGGYSTIWYNNYFEKLETIETNNLFANWLFNIGLPVSICHDLKLICECKVNNSSLSDIVVVDTDGDREGYILNAFNICNKYFIVDNWQQPEVSVYSDEIVRYLYANTKEQLIFKQPNHKDWKTAIFIK